MGETEVEIKQKSLRDFKTICQGQKILQLEDCTFKFMQWMAEYQ